MTFPAVLSMRALGLLVGLLATGSSSCAPEIEHIDAKTQIMLRINSSKDLRTRFSTLRVGVARRQTVSGLEDGESWGKRTEQMVERAVIKRWPVDIPLTPGDRSSAFAQFEVVVEARDGVDLLAQTRAVSSFVPGERRVLELRVEPCTGKPAGFVCSDSACQGPDCEDCDSSGACTAVGLTDPKSLSSLDDVVPTAERGDAGGRDASVARDANVRRDAATDPDPDARPDAASPPDVEGEPDAAIEPGPTPTDSACTQPNGLRCAMPGTSLRDRCQDGTWATSAPCADSEICTAGDVPGATTCRKLVEVCKGNADKPICDGSSMLFCDKQGLVERTLSCASNAQCTLGLTDGKCAFCTPGSFHCDGASLEKCGTDGQSFVAVTPACASAALCNEAAGACTKEACLPDSKLCAGDVLRGCNATQTAFEDIKTCKAGLCDTAGKQCDECNANSKKCDGNDVKTCDAQGQGYTTAACPTGRPLCTGSGACVQCTLATDCPAVPECSVSMCNTASGTCASSFKSSGSPCSAGICDGKGVCGPAPRCGDGIKNQGALEECDDGNQVNNDDCTNACKKSFCGDGIIAANGAVRPESCEVGKGGATKWTCGQCQLQTIYNSCGSNAQCTAPEVCSLGFCTVQCTPLNGWGAGSNCPAPPSPLVAWCNAGVGICQLTDCKTNSDCPASNPTCKSAVGEFQGVSFTTMCAN